MTLNHYTLLTLYCTNISTMCSNSLNKPNFFNTGVPGGAGAGPGAGGLGGAGGLVPGAGGKA